MRREVEKEKKKIKELVASEASILASWGVDFGFLGHIFGFLGVIFGALRVIFGLLGAPWGRLGPSWVVRVVLGSLGRADARHLGEVWEAKREPR